MYKFIIRPSHKLVIVLSTYAGKTVRGIAKCSPNDTFDPEFGINLAKLRCDLKIAKKREQRAKRKVDEALKAYTEAWTHLRQMRKYEEDARIAVDLFTKSLNKKLGTS